MKVLRNLQTGITAFPSLNSRDRQWVISSLRKSVEAQGMDDLATFLRSKRRGARRPVVFLSHSHTDKPFVRSLAVQLRLHGIDVWLDEAELRVADSLVDKLMRSIDTVDFMLVVLSPSSVRSRWVQEELRAAISRQIQNQRITVLPLLKGKCEVPTFLRDRLYADFTTPYRRATNLPRLVESIMSHYRERTATRQTT